MLDHCDLASNAQYSLIKLVLVATATHYYYQCTE